MMQRIMMFPMVLLLSLKCSAMGAILKMAQEQTQDAAALGCPHCLLSKGDCCGNETCRIQRFKDREQRIFNEISELRVRISLLKGI